MASEAIHRDRVGIHLDMSKDPSISVNMEMISIESNRFSIRSGESQPVLPLSNSDQDRPPSNKDQTSRTRILNLLAAGPKNLFLIPLRHLRARLKKPSGGGDSGFSAILKVFLFFIAIFAVIWIVIPSSSTIMNSLSILHQVPEGHVGVYWRGGALLKTINDPGFHLKLPFITRYEPVQVTLQTDQVRDIPCGTKGGVMINFEKIVVVNRLDKDYVHDTLLKYGGQYDKILIYEKIHQEINQFCNSHSLQQVYIDVFDQIDGKMKDALQGDCRRNAPGIEIISVHVTKPTIPESISRYFEQLEEERIKGLIATEKQRVVEKEAETDKNKAISEAENSANVRKILMEQNLMEKDSAMKQQEIENQIYMAREKSLADAYFYRESKKAEANKLKLTPEYLELIVFKGILVNKNRSSEEYVAIKKISSEENVFVYSIMFVYMCARRLLVYFL